MRALPEPDSVPDKVEQCRHQTDYVNHVGRLRFIYVLAHDNNQLDGQLRYVLDAEEQEEHELGAVPEEDAAMETEFVSEAGDGVRVDRVCIAAAGQGCSTRYASGPEGSW